MVLLEMKIIVRMRIAKGDAEYHLQLHFSHYLQLVADCTSS